MPRTWLTITFCILTVAFAGRALFVVGDQLRKARQPALDQAVVETRYYAALRPHLPATGTVGYLTVSDKDTDTRVRHYILVQYTLAPLIVHESSDEPIVIANFPDARSLQNAMRGTHLRMRTWLGPAAPGLAVLENVDPTAPAPVAIPWAGEAAPQ